LVLGRAVKAGLLKGKQITGGILAAPRDIITNAEFVVFVARYKKMKMETKELKL